jgi:hypothetical protein
MPSLDDIRDLTNSTIDDDDLAAIYAAEKAWLIDRIGPLDGPRTERFVYTQGSYYAILRLQRRASVFEPFVVNDRDVEVLPADYELRRKGFRVAPLHRSWTFPVEITYTPGDRNLVRAGLVRLVRLGLDVVSGDATKVQETIGSYSYTNVQRGPGSAAGVRRTVLASILERKEPESAIILGGSRVDPRSQVLSEHSLWP